jgi:hypothetical protein
MHGSVKVSWRDARHVASDQDLVPLRRRAEFQKLLAGMQAGKNSGTRGKLTTPARILRIVCAVRGRTSHSG